MKYPSEFVEKVKNEFPECIELHRALEGDEAPYEVGHFLESSTGLRMQPEEILDAITKNEVWRIKEDAEKAVRCYQLCLEWSWLYKTYLANGGKPDDICRG